MKIKTFLVRSLTLAAGLCAASNIVNASVATFSDTWKDAAVLNANSNYAAVDSGSFSVHISLGGVVSSNFGPDTVVWLKIAPTNGAPPLTIVTNRLIDDPSYTAKSTSVTFPFFATTNGTVAVSWGATNITISGSTKTDLLGEDKEYSASVSSNFFLDQIVLIVSNVSATAALFGYTNIVVPVVANNATTEAAHPNLNGSTTSLQAGSLSGAADFTPPSLAITSPAANAKIPYTSPTSSTVAVSGTASDKYGLSNITITVNGVNSGASSKVYQAQAGSEGNAATSIAWTNNVTLSVIGTNVINVTATNWLGNTNSVSRIFILLETNSAVVVVVPTNSGTVSGIWNNKVLDMGIGYPVAATPANPAWIFSRWTNSAGLNVTNPSFTFIATNLPLYAYFTNNPFYDTGLAGTYEALFYSATKVEPTNSGYIILTVTPSGTYSGSLYLADKVSPFSLFGQLAVAGANATADSIVNISGSEQLNVQLHVATNSDRLTAGAGLLSGWVTYTNFDTTATWNDSIWGKLVQFSPDIVPGLYNLAFSPALNPSNGPGGYSFASAMVSKTGNVGMVLTLADGTSPATSFSADMTLDGLCPIYSPLYGGNGVILGWMHFDLSGLRTTTGAFTWVKAAVNDKFYTNGFTLATNVSGQLYEPLNIFSWTTNGIFAVDQGYTSVNLANGTHVNVTFDPFTDTLTDPNQARDYLTMKLNPSTGALSGSFGAAFFNLQTNTIGLPSFKGVVTGNQGMGFYMATNMETGPILIQP